MLSSPNSGCPLRNRRWRSSEYSLRRGQETLHPSIPPACRPKGAGESFEESLDLVMIRPPVKKPGVDVGFGPARETLKEVVDQFGLQITHKAGCHPGFDDRSGTPAKIYRRHAHGLIHRHEKVSGT